MCSLRRYGGTPTPHERSPAGGDGRMFQGEDDVCHESVQEERHDRDAVELDADVVDERSSRNTILKVVQV